MNQNTQYHDLREKYAEEAYKKDYVYPNRFCFVLTNKCNLSCEFCFQDRRQLRGALSLEDWKRVVDQLPEGAWVTVTGGEPFAFRGFQEIVSYADSTSKCNS